MDSNQEKKKPTLFMKADSQRPTELRALSNRGNHLLDSSGVEGPGRKTSCACLLDRKVVGHRGTWVRVRGWGWRSGLSSCILKMKTESRGQTN